MHRFRDVPYYESCRHRRWKFARVTSGLLFAFEGFPALLGGGSVDMTFICQDIDRCESSIPGLDAIASRMRNNTLRMARIGMAGRCGHDRNNTLVNSTLIKRH